MIINELQDYLREVVHDPDINIYNVNKVPFNIYALYNQIVKKYSDESFFKIIDCLFHVPEEGSEYSIEQIFHLNEKILSEIDTALSDIYQTLEVLLSNPFHMELLNIQKHKSFRNALKDFHSNSNNYILPSFTKHIIKLLREDPNEIVGLYEINGFKYEIIDAEKDENNNSLTFVIDEFFPFREIGSMVYIIDQFRGILIIWLNKFHLYITKQNQIHSFPIEDDSKIKLEIKSKLNLLPKSESITNVNETSNDAPVITDWSELKLQVFNNNQIIEKIGDGKSKHISPDKFGFLFNGTDWKNFCEIAENTIGGESFLEGRRRKYKIAKIIENRYYLESPFGRKSSKTGRFSVNFTLSCDED